MALPQEARVHLELLYNNAYRRRVLFFPKGVHY